MARKRHSAEEIVAKLRQVDVLLAQGKPVSDAVRPIGVRKLHIIDGVTSMAGLRATRLAAEGTGVLNMRLRRAISDLTLDKLILQEAARGNF